MNWRTSNFIKQLKFSFGFKLLSILISFLLVRYLLKYLDIRDYGLWSVILSFLNWVVFFDLGIANGVKNKIAESLSSKKTNEAKKFISTGYISLFFFSSFVYLFVLIFSRLINWQIVFNSHYHSNDYFQSLILIILFFTLFNFILSLINNVFNAIQRASLVTLNQFVTQILSLLTVSLLLIYTKPDLRILAFGYGLSILLSNLILSIWFYNKNKNLSPSFKDYDKKKVKSIIHLGLRFFLLQLTMMIILTTDRFILIQLAGAEDVTRYDIISRYFKTVVIFHTIINAPLWSMYTDAYSKRDFNWLEKTMKNLIKLFGVYVLGVIVMIVFGKKIINFWLNNDNLGLSISNYIYMGVLVLFNIAHSILAYFTNGIGKTKIQMMTSIIGAVLNIPLSIFFVNYLNLGINGVILATVICLSFFCFIGPFQVYKEIKLIKLGSSS
ncbi:MATE family efflux transporter [Gaetbulibacter aestuarii]|uniref:MATE family efflux transporter n=1 Tax=Gaetbulibacter aestuarii TaxID=1502358 RepID=A0ABW7MVI5_9FLAO